MPGERDCDDGSDEETKVNESRNEVSKRDRMTGVKSIMKKRVE